MSLQPSDRRDIDRTTTSPFLLRLFWRQSQPHDAFEFSVAPPEDTSSVTDYTSLLPSNLRQQSVQIYTWPTCTLAELTGLLSSVLPEEVSMEVGTRLMFKLIFADTRADVVDGRGRFLDKPLGSVVVGGRGAALDNDDVAGTTKDNLEGDAEKTLADARFVIGDYVACALYPPGADGRIQQPPIAPRAGGRDPYAAPRGPPGPRENGFGGGYRGGRGGGFRGGGGFGGPPPPGDWRRGERPPPGGGGGYGGYGGYRGGRGRPY